MPYTASSGNRRRRGAKYWKRQPLRPGHPVWKSLSRQERDAVRAANRVMGGAIKAGNFIGPKKWPSYYRKNGQDIVDPGGGKKSGDGFFGSDPLKPKRNHHRTPDHLTGRGNYGKNNPGKGRPGPGGKGGGHKHGKGGGSGKGSGKSGGGGGGNSNAMSYYGMGKFNGPSRKKAGLIVQREINRQLRELASEARQTKHSGREAVKKIHGQRRATIGDLDYLYNEADDYIGAQKQQIDSRYNQTKENVGNIFADLQQSQGQQIDATRAAAMAEMQRLGIQQTGMGQYDADAAFLQGLGQQQAADVDANLRSQQTGASAIGDLLQGMSRGSRASQIGQATTDAQESINDVRGDVRGQLLDIFDSMRGVRAERPAMTNELWMQMQDSAYQQWAETNQINFQNQLATNQFNLDVDKLSSDNLWKKAELRQAAKKESAKRRQQRQMDAARAASRRIMDAAGSLW
jgi:hypothetical protein